MKSTVGDQLYQRIKANRAANNIPGRAKSKGSETLLPEGRGVRHDVDEIGSPHDKVFMYDRGGGNISTGRCAHGTSGVLRRLKNKMTHGSSPRVRERLLWYSCILCPMANATHLPFRESSLPRCTLKEGRYELKRRCSTWSVRSRFQIQPVQGYPVGDLLVFSPIRPRLRLQHDHHKFQR